MRSCFTIRKAFLLSKVMNKLIMRASGLMSCIGLLMLMTSCSSDGLKIRWEQYSVKELQKFCGSPSKTRIAGCAKRAGNQCVVATYKGDPELNDSLGHEVRHCFEGAWH